MEISCWLQEILSKRTELGYLKKKTNEGASLHFESY